MGLKDLFLPKWKHSDSDVRLTAVKKLTDQRVLAEIAKNDGDWNASQAAVEKLTDQTLLADLAKTSRKWIHVREAAVKKLSL